MHACDNAISFEHKKLSAISGFYHSAVITWAIDNAVSERKVGQKLAKQLIFTYVAAVNLFGL
jgi:hypothetical protein